MNISTTVGFIFCFISVLAPSFADRPFHDPGVDIGIVRTSTGLFVGPDGSCARISALQPGDWVILVSRTTTNNWYNAIQLSSGKEGWVRADRMSIKYTHHPNASIVLPTQLTGTDSQPEITVENDSNTQMYLHVSGADEVVIGPYSKQNILVNAGLCSFNASAAGVIPVFGNKVFVDGEDCSWKFWIGSNNGSRSRRNVDQADKIQIHALVTQISIDDAALAADRQALTSEKAALAVQANKLQADQDDITSKRQTLDQTDQSAIDAFNAEVDAVNAELTAYQTADKQNDADNDAYNLLVDKVNAERAKLDPIADRVNRD
jgi:hypothetical protein